MRIVTIIGARPQFIKAAPVSRALRNAGHEEVLVHTGQHYDYEMSQVFFEELNIPEPDINLNVGSGSHGFQTGNILIEFEAFVRSRKPDWVFVYGDTNSTLAGALAACKLSIPLAHIEAGLRSFNRAMPEEHNRVLTDHCSDLLFCPTQNAVDNLGREGINQGARLVGDTMYDAVLEFIPIARSRSTVLKRLGLKTKQYLLATVHRAYNTDINENLIKILSALKRIDEPVVFPMHPRTRKRLDHLCETSGFNLSPSNILLCEPVSYMDMLILEENARLILTDSGGMQKEAYFLSVPCITLRPETEWVETVEAGWNIIVGQEPERIVDAARNSCWPSEQPLQIYGTGDAAIRIVKELNCYQL